MIDDQTMTAKDIILGAIKLLETNSWRVDTKVNDFLVFRNKRVAHPFGLLAYAGDPVIRKFADQSIFEDNFYFSEMISEVSCYFRKVCGCNNPLDIFSRKHEAPMFFAYYLVYATSERPEFSAHTTSKKKIIALLKESVKLHDVFFPE